MERFLRPDRTWTRSGLFFALLFSAAYFHHPVEYDSTNSRYFLLSAVVDDRRLDIERFKDQTIDVSVSDGRVYSNKAIGASLLAAPVYWTLRSLTPLRRDAPLSSRARYLCRLVTTSLPHALLGAVMFQLLLGMGAAPRDAFYTVLAYAFGTIAWLHASLFSGHQLAASMSFLSFALIWFLSRAGNGGGGLGWFAAGLLAGTAALCDYTAAALAATLACYALKKSASLARTLLFLLGTAAAVLPLGLYNAACFGHPLSLSYAHLPPGEWGGGASRGIFGVGPARLGVVASLLASPSRGLFFIMPVLLLSLPGFQAWFRRTSRDPRLRWDPWAAAAAVCAYLAINAGYFGWHGGWTFGPRYLVPMIPFLALPMAFALDRPWLPPLLLLSFLQVLAAQAVLPHAPDVVRNPILECILPLFRYGYLADNPGLRMGMKNSWSLLPFFAALVPLLWAIRPDHDAPAVSRPAEAARRGWRWLYAGACLGIPLALALARSPSAALVHRCNAHLLGNAAHALSSVPLARAAWLATTGAPPDRP